MIEINLILQKKHSTYVKHSNLIIIYRFAIYFSELEDFTLYIDIFTYRCYCIIFFFKEFKNCFLFLRAVAIMINTADQINDRIASDIRKFILLLHPV